MNILLVVNDLIGLFMLLKEAWMPLGIAVGNVGLVQYHQGEIEETRKQLHARQPLGRMGRPDEIAPLALYLASDEAAYVTGSQMVIDGGLTAK